MSATVTAFTPISALVGGLLIGIASALLMGLNGRIAGISGIFRNVLPPQPSADWPWRLAFVVGLVVGPLVVAWVRGAPPAISFPMGLPAMALAGFLVGVGTTLGHGCTSGHGVCGLARLSARSLVATATFMVAGVATVFLVRHVVGG